MFPVLRSLGALLDDDARHPVASVKMHAVDRSFCRGRKKTQQCDNRTKATHEAFCLGWAHH